jgi:hypothetical protein
MFLPTLKQTTALGGTWTTSSVVDDFVRARVPRLAGRLEARVEDAEVAELHSVAFGEFGDDLIQEHLHDLFGHDLRISGALGDSLAEFPFRHGSIGHR